VLPDIPDIRTVIGVTAVVAVTCIIFVGLSSMGEWYGFVDKGITMEKLLVSVREVVESDESFVIHYVPKDLPPKSTLFDYFDLWNWDGTLDRIHHVAKPWIMK
jgi:hypothetical protein